MFNRKNNSNTDQNKIGELPSFEARTDLAVEEQESFAGVRYVPTGFPMARAPCSSIIETSVNLI